jgi:hypothetical protein
VFCGRDNRSFGRITDRHPPGCGIGKRYVVVTDAGARDDLQSRGSAEELFVITDTRRSDDGFCTFQPFERICRVFTGRSDDQHPVLKQVKVFRR